MNLAEELRTLLGETCVAADEATRRAHAGDKWFALAEPEATSRPS